ncbi:MAG: SDR family NAD(P)-dependent oxidoreductase [Pseudomonadota bacterium]
MYDKQTFTDKTALVTGGRSGIGYAIAKQYLALGATVIIASRKEEPLAAAAKEPWVLLPRGQNPGGLPREPIENRGRWR